MMKSLSENELLFVSGGDSGSIAEEFVSEFVLTIIAPIAYLEGALLFGAALGHIGGTVLGYRAASSYGQFGLLGSSLIGAGTGIVCCAIGAYAGIGAAAYLGLGKDN